MAASDNGREPCVPLVLSSVVEDLLDNAQDTDCSKILNALDFPLWDGSCDRNGYATDMAAWDVTRSLHIFDLRRSTLLATFDGALQASGTR